MWDNADDEEGQGRALRGDSSLIIRIDIAGAIIYIDGSGCEQQFCILSRVSVHQVVTQVKHFILQINKRSISSRYYQNDKIRLTLYLYC